MISILPIFTSIFLVFPSLDVKVENLTLLQNFQSILTIKPEKPEKILTNNPIQCMAHTIYHEARSEPIKGQIAVASVVLTRVQAKRWKSTICGVVKMNNAFSFVDNKTKSVPPVNDKEKWQQAWILATLIKNPVPEMKTIDHYHNHSVHPYWNRFMKLEMTIGNHLFYSDPTTQFAQNN